MEETGMTNRRMRELHRYLTLWSALKRLGILLVGLAVGIGCGRETEVIKKTQPHTGKLEEYEIYRDEINNKPIKHGYYKSFHEDGTYMEVGQFEQGEMVGRWVSFDANGQLRFAANYKSGKREGKSLEYDKNRKLVKTEVYENGVLVE
jgi:antitoxin component YwqK of YwqJK toxin-antitoxin module